MRALRRQHGQTAAEALGVLVLVAVIVGVLATSDAGGRIRDGIKVQICKIAQQENCETEAADEGPKSPYCINGSDSTRVEADAWVSARLLKGGALGAREYRLVELPDGTYQASIRFEGGAFVGQGLGSRAPVDAEGRLTGGWTVAFNPQSKEDAENLLREYQNADAQTLAFIATKRVPRCAMLTCVIGEVVEAGVDKLLGNDVLPDYYSDIEDPGVRSETFDGGSDVSVSVSPESVARSRDRDPDDEEGSSSDVSGSLGIEAENRIGVTQTEDGPDEGSNTVFYESEVGFEGNATFGPLIERALGGKASGKTRIAVTIDSNGDPTKLTVVHTGQVSGSAGLDGKLQGARSFGSVADKVPFVEGGASASDGTGLELTTEIDLTDPELRRQAKIALTGRDPETGEETSRVDAAGALGDAVRDSSSIGLREFDTESTEGDFGLDLIVAGGGASISDSSQSTTGYHLFDPSTGEWTRYDRCPNGHGGTVTTPN